MSSQLKAGEILIVETESLADLLKDVRFQTALCEQIKLFLPAKRWYGSKDDVISHISIEKTFSLQDQSQTYFMLVKVTLASTETPLYAIPVRMVWAEKAKSIFEHQPKSVIATVCFGQKLGVLYDAVGESDFASGVLSLMQNDSDVALDDGVSLVASATEAGKEMIKVTKGLEQKLLGVEQSNSSVVIGKKIILKMYRRVAYGDHPEVATTRFLTQEVGFANTPAYYGVLELKDKKGVPLALGILQEFVPNQGDGWGYTMEYLKQFFKDALEQKVQGKYHEPYLETIRTLGKRTAQMHACFALGKDAVFAPVAISEQDLKEWREQVLIQAEKTRSVIKNGLDNLSGEIKIKTESLLKHWNTLVARINVLVPSQMDAVKTRFHGDYHLGQIVLVDTDFYILDFEGEPLRPLMERQVKHTVLKDVAGMVRSFDYAANGAVLMYVLPQNRAMISSFVNDWQTQATRAFLEGYFETLGSSCCLPQNKTITQNVLDLFILEKALYEVIYEVSNRPDWVAIPVNGMERLVDLDGEVK